VSLRGFRPRPAELAVWALIAACVLNFAPALFSSENIVREPLWQKGLKDAPLLVLFLVALLVPGRRTTDDPAMERLRRGYGWLLAVLAGAMTVDVLVRGTALLTFLVSLRYYVLYPALVLAVWRLDLNRPEVTRLVKGIALVGAAESLLAVVNFVGLVGDTYYRGYLHIAGEEFTRATATLGNPDNLGVFLGLPTMMLLSGAAFRGTWARILLCVVLIGMALTLSRTAALALIVVVLLSLPLRRPAFPDRWKVVTALVLAAAVAVAALSVRGVDASAPSDLLGARVDTVPLAFTRWISDPGVFLIGEGYGTQSETAGPGLPTAEQPVIDSMPLFLALEGGVVAVVLFALLVVTTFRLAIRAAREDPSALRSGALGYGAFFLAYTPVLVNFRLFPGAPLFWLFLGLAAGALGSARATRRRGEVERTSVIGPRTALAGALVVLVALVAVVALDLQDPLVGAGSAKRAISRGLRIHLVEGGSAPPRLGVRAKYIWHSRGEGLLLLIAGNPNRAADFVARLARSRRADVRIARERNVIVIYQGRRGGQRLQQIRSALKSLDG
jgi:hypothetical protein